MRKITINGKEITTNYNSGRYHDYSIITGDRGTMVYKRSQITGDDLHRECDREMLLRLVEEGYTRITFYYTTTSVRGYYKLIAYCK